MLTNTFKITHSKHIKLYSRGGQPKLVFEPRSKFKKKSTLWAIYSQKRGKMPKISEIFWVGNSLIQDWVAEIYFWPLLLYRKLEIRLLIFERIWSPVCICNLRLKNSTVLALYLSIYDQNKIFKKSQCLPPNRNLEVEGSQ
jgi:hypothetical protein